MTAEELIFSLLGPLVGDRVFPDAADFGTQLPYITYRRFGGQAVQTLGREVPNKINGFFQINVWCARRMDATALIEQVEALFRLTEDAQCSPLAGASDEYEEDLQLHGASQDFTIWTDRQ